MMGALGKPLPGTLLEKVSNVHCNSMKVVCPGMNSREMNPRSEFVK